MTTPGSNPSLAGKVLHTVGSATHTCAPRLGQQQTPHILCYSHVCASLAVDSRRGGARCRRGVAPRDSPLRPRRHPLALLRGRRAARAQRGAGRTAAPLARRGRPDQGRHALRLALRLAPGEPGGHSGAIGVPAAPRRGAAAWWHIGGATKAQRGGAAWWRGGVGLGPPLGQAVAYAVSYAVAAYPQKERACAAAAHGRGDRFDRSGQVCTRVLPRVKLC